MEKRNSQLISFLEYQQSISPFFIDKSFVEKLNRAVALLESKQETSEVPVKEKPEQASEPSVVGITPPKGGKTPSPIERIKKPAEPSPEENVIHFPLNAVASVSSLEDLEKLVSPCTRCRLSATRTNLVFGEGNPDAKLMFIGEGPGSDEDLSGRPFVGKAGMLLTKIIENGLKLSREDVYIANIVKCRPPHNRDPRPDEAKMCIGYLKRQIELVSPDVIVLLGRVAMKNLLGLETSISKARNMDLDYNGIPVFVTYHPSALLRNDTYKRPTWEDMKKVIRKLDLFKI